MSTRAREGSPSGAHRSSPTVQRLPVVSSPTSSQPRAPSPVAGGIREEAVVMTAHYINNLPREMQQLDPSRVQFELVVHATVKYYLERQDQILPGSIARLEMPPLSVAFSSASILYRRERFSVDFDNLRSSDTSLGASMPTALNNKVIWRYPQPGHSNVKIIYEVFVGVKERRMGSTTSGWVAAGGQQAGSSALDPQGFRFLIPAEAVTGSRIATRLVGLSIGQVALTVTVPPPESPAYSYRMAVERLSQLCQRLRPRLPGNFSLEDKLKAFTGSDGCIDEIHAYTAVRKIADPLFFKNRLDRLLGLYNAAHPDENTQRSAALLCEWDGREELMMRSVVMELGPELSSILPRHRMTAFMKKYRLSEQHVAFAFPGGVYSSTALDTDTESVFDRLTAKYGSEPRPTSYLFPPVSYEPDRRAYLLDCLSFPSNKPNKNWRDIALAARQKRIPFTSSPLERETNRESKSGRALSEIEILQEKHEAEFKQIIPAIADALNSVIAQHSELQRPRDDRFSVFETNNVPGIQLEDYIHRIAEYTYISPSSMLGAAIFLDRMCERYPGLTLSDRNIFKLFFVSVRVASKVVDLRSLNNKNFASVGGIGNKHLNELEDAFLKYIKFDLYLAPTEFAEYGRRLNPPQHSAVQARKIAAE